MPPRNGRKKASTKSPENPSRRRASAVVTCGAVSSSFSEKRERRRRSRTTLSLSRRLPGAPQTLERLDGVPPRVGEAREAAVPADQRAALERPQPEPVVVEHPARLRVRGEQDLEAAVELEAVHHVRAHAPARRVRPLEHQDVQPGGAQLAGAAEAGEARSDDDDVRHRRRRSRGGRARRRAPPLGVRAGGPRHQALPVRRQSPQVVADEPVEEQPPYPGQVGRPRLPEPAVARLGEHGVVPAPVLRAALAAHQALALQPVHQARHAAGADQRRAGEVAHAQPPARRVLEQQQHLVGPQGEIVLRDQFGVQLAEDRALDAQEAAPRRQLGGAEVVTGLSLCGHGPPSAGVVDGSIPGRFTEKMQLAGRRRRPHAGHALMRSRSSAPHSTTVSRPSALAR